MHNNFIKSPLNYTGNKYRILSQITKFFPDKCHTFVDLFCGGATVGFNVKADRVILIDSNPQIINLLKTLANSDLDKIIREVERNIYKYNLSYSFKFGYSFYKEKGFVEGNNGLKKYNSDGFYNLRNNYNKIKNKNSFKANIMLYTLMTYAFNNDIRFNLEGEFNLPVGKTDFNKNNYNKLIEYNKRAKEINFEFINSDFRDNEVEKILFDSDFVYCDPPYLITFSEYNKLWNEKDEKELVEYLDLLNSKKIKFAVSNLISYKNKENFIFKEWAKKYHISPIKSNYISYHDNSIKNFNEVLVTNYEQKNIELQTSIVYNNHEKPWKVKRFSYGF